MANASSGCVCGITEWAWTRRSWMPGGAPGITDYPACRNAQAARIEVEIQYGERQFRLRVRDNGMGMDSKILDAGRRSGHHGLPGMQERTGRPDRSGNSVWRTPVPAACAG